MKKKNQHFLKVINLHDILDCQNWNYLLKLNSKYQE